MNARLIVSTLPILVAGCSVLQSTSHDRTLTQAASTRAAPEAATPPPATLLPWPEDDANPEHPKTVAAGDYFVYRFAGSFTDSLVEMTEQVVDIEGDVLVVDFILKQGELREALRVRLDLHTRQALSVAHLQDGEEVPVSPDAYAALIARTQFVPDSNEETLATRDSTCLVGVDEVECRVTSYRVNVGSGSGTLTISQSDAIPGRDIGGMVVGEDGELIYSARLVEHGSDAPDTSTVVSKAARATRKIR